MQISTVPPSEDDGDPETTIEMTITPSASPPQDTVPESSTQTETPARKLFNAVSACSNLHPDLVGDGDEADGDDDDADPILFEGGVGYESGIIIPSAAAGSDDSSLPPPFPGSGGWITAENVGEYFDAEGNWTGRGEGQSAQGLGPGAGSVRPREDESGPAAPSAPAVEAATEGEETKWRRTD